ncbi:MAG: BlaI/MecI/CopY family transcriptional regulator [Candidatus Brocadiaceae bacterium]|nr:BlaI/MecI/CopY family transcriptional regulator [Candidatus Brocadiaceae bacterium]
MGRAETCTLTPLEAAVMNVVWELSEATTRQVHEQLRRTAPRAYNTVLMVMRVLHQKGLLADERRGRSVVYRPTVTREEGAEQAIKDLADRFFACSVPALLGHVIRHMPLNRRELRGIRRELDRRDGESAERTR